RAIGPCQCLRADPAAVPTPHSRARRYRSLPAVGVHRDSSRSHPPALLASASLLRNTLLRLTPQRKSEHPHAPTRTLEARSCACSAEPRAAHSAATYGKPLAKARACAIFRADSLARRHRAHCHNFRGVAQNGKKGWRTDEVGSPDSDLKGHRALAQAGGGRVRFPGWRDLEELEERRSVHDPRAVEAEGRQEACHEGTRRG